MKTFISIFAMFFSLGAFAQVLEVQATEKLVYYAPVPVLTAQLLDLDRDGGVLTLTLDYEARVHRNQSEELKLKYPGYDLKPVVVRASEESMTIAIPEIGIRKETVLRQAQMGPLLSAQFTLNQSQVAGLKALLRDRPQALQIRIPAKAEIRGSTEIEVYETSNAVCAELRVQTLGDFVTAITALKKPAKIRFDQTFQQYKLRLIDQCFEIPGKVVAQSFTDLLRTRIQVKSGEQTLRAAYSESRLRDVNVDLIPIVKFESN